MRLLKLALISAIGLFLLLTAISLLIPSSVRISRAIDINAPRVSVLPFVQEGKNWGKWNEYLVQEKGQWQNERQWQGSRYAISLKAISDSVVLSVWTPIKGNAFESVYSVMEPRPGIITVQWYFDFHLGWYPWEKFGSIVYDRQVGPVMEQSLTHLKQLVESNQ